MASAFGHSIFAATLTKCFKPQLSSRRLWFLSIFVSVIPDFDSVGFFMGVPYSSIFGHRGLSHSMLFAVLFCLSLLLVFYWKEKKKVPLFLVLVLCMLSHGFLDAFTNGGLGVGFFIPFENSRYFFPFRPIEASPIRINRFFEQASTILWNELIWIGIPCIAILLAHKAVILLTGKVRRLRSK
jgi:inner membrane protein